MALEKKPRPSNVTDIGEGRGAGARRGRGRPSGLGYDPSTGKEIRTGTTRDDGEFDVFNLVDDRSYKPSRFYTRSVNAHNHGEDTRVKFPQGLLAQIHAAVGDIPQYDTAQDLIRDAVMHRLEWLQHHYNLDESMRRFIELERMEADTERAVREVNAMTKAVQSMRDALEHHWQAQDWQMFADEINRGEERVEWMREPYRTEGMRVLRDWKHRGKEQLRKMRDEE